MIRSVNLSGQHLGAIEAVKLLRSQRILSGKPLSEVC